MDKIKSLLAEHKVNPECEEKLKIYIQELFKWNRKINLIGREDLDWLIEDLITPVFLIKDWIDKKNIIEIGAGAGVVGVILSLLITDAKITLVERRERKCAFIRFIRNKLGLNYNLLCKDIRKKDINEIYDFLVIRGIKIEKWHFNFAHKIIYFGNINDTPYLDKKEYKNIKIYLLKGVSP